MTQRDGEYANEVREELRTRCIHLLTKEAFLEIPAAEKQSIKDLLR